MDKQKTAQIRNTLPLIAGTKSRQTKRISDMDFNTIIKDNFLGLLESADFKIIDDTKNSVTFKSDKVTIKFVFNSFSFEYSYFINLNNQDITFENNIVEGYLKVVDEPIFGLKTQDEKSQLWTTRKFNYFVKHQDTLLTGDKIFYADLNQYQDKVSADYNKNLNS